MPDRREGRGEILATAPIGQDDAIRRRLAREPLGPTSPFFPRTPRLLDMCEEPAPDQSPGRGLPSEIHAFEPFRTEVADRQIGHDDSGGRVDVVVVIGFLNNNADTQAECVRMRKKPPKADRVPIISDRGGADLARRGASFSPFEMACSAWVRAAVRSPRARSTSARL